MLCSQFLSVHCEISVCIFPVCFQHLCRTFVLQKLWKRFYSKLNNWCHYFWLRYALWAYSCRDSVRPIKPGVYIITTGAVWYF